MSWTVKGALFADYVRMMRGRPGVSWDAYLEPADLPYLAAWIDPNAWYPMASFERMGNAIFQEIAGGDLKLVRFWGRLSVGHLATLDEELIVAGDPRESLMRFRAYRKSFFDFDALELTMLLDEEARLRLSYGMGDAAEEAASYQTVGFFEGLLDLAGAGDVAVRFEAKSWEGEAHTMVSLRWRPS